jgi:hypothetical protein
MVSFPTITMRQLRRTTSSTSPWGYVASARGSRTSSLRTCGGKQLRSMASACTREIRGRPVGGSSDGDRAGSQNCKGQALR